MYDVNRHFLLIYVNLYAVLAGILGLGSENSLLALALKAVFLTLRFVALVLTSFSLLVLAS